MAARAAETSVAGHRGRLRARFLKGRRAAMGDYELLELLLTFAIPRVDTKPLAKRLLARFGTLGGVIDQPAEALLAIDGVGPQTTVLLLAVRDIMTRYLEDQMDAAPSLQTPEDVVAFARLEIGARQREAILVLCLSDSNRLIHKAVVSEGTVNRSTIYAREVLKPALVHNATRLVLVHNHPSGDPSPSEEDHRMTRRVERLASEFDVSLVDHLIVTPQRAFSLKTGKML